MNVEPWYAVKCIFLHTDLKTEDENASIYEERIILVKAIDENLAITRAEQDAKEYAEDCGGAKFISYTMMFHLFDEKIEHLTELFSVMRESAKNPEEYLDHFYDTGKERARTYDDN